MPTVSLNHLESVTSFREAPNRSLRDAASSRQTARILFSWQPSNWHRVVTIGQLGRQRFCHTAAMATKTISEYLEDERRSREETQLRTDEEADRIQSLHPGHHRTRKSPEQELPAPVEVVVKAKKPAVAKARKPAAAKVRKPAAAKAKKPAVAKARKPAVGKARKTVAAKTTKPAGAVRRKPPAARKSRSKARRKA